MKNIVASVGLVALGATGLQSASLPGLMPDGTKPWSVSATLRGFYDDNVNTAPSGSLNRRDSVGVEVSPSAIFNWTLEQTVMSFSYLYSLKYYDKQPIGNSEKYSQSHNFNAMLEHAFNERYQLHIRDSFVIGQEPDLLRSGNAFTTFQRIPGDNIRNSGSINFDAQITPLFGLEAGYANALFDYHDHGHFASRSGVLDRLEHTLHLDSRWTIQPETIAVVGYQFRQVNYTGNEVIGFVSTGALKSQDRDDREHYVYIGVDHVFRPDLTGSVRVGGRYIDYYSDPNGNNTSFGPYANASLKWTYAPDSYVEAGLSHDLNASDIVGDNGTNFTTDEESTVLYANWRHRFTPKIHASIVGQFQDSSFDGGSVNSKTERYYLIGLNAAYDFSSHFSTEVGYNYDKVHSEIGGRSFDRNRVYIGVTASY